MKKNISTWVIALIALVGGYVAGAYLGIPGVSSQETAGDINHYNKYGDILLGASTLSFNAEYRDNSEVQQRTTQTLDIVGSRFREYCVLIQFAQSLDVKDEQVAAAIAQMATSASRIADLTQGIEQATQVAQNVEGASEEECNQALENTEAALKEINTHIQDSKKLVEAVDAAIGQNPRSDAMLATLRDLVAGYCSVNSVLLQDENERDYWTNLPALLTDDDMAVNLVVD